MMGKCQANLVGNEDSTTATMANSNTSASPATVSHEPSLLSIFHEDVLLSILGFVADVPFEARDGRDVNSFCPFSIPGQRHNTRNNSNQQREPINPHSSLTHTLPLVSKQFHRLCSTHDLFWKSALLRLLDREGDLWEEGLKRVVLNAECEEIRGKIVEANRIGVGRREKRTRNGVIGRELVQADNVVDLTTTDDGDTNVQQATYNKNSSETQSSSSSSLSKEEILLDKACKAMEDHPPQNHTATSSGVYQCIYQSIVHHHMRYQAPVFYMPTSIRLGHEYGLHFFEPRYRILISEVMSSYPVSARRGQAIQPLIAGVSPTARPVRDDALKSKLQNFLEKNKSLIAQYHTPTFIHAHQSPLRPNTPATIVRVRHCQVEADGRADVLLEPIAYIWLEQIWTRPGTGGLIEARGVRMEKDTSDRYEMWCAMSAFGRGDGRGWGQMLPIP